MSQITLEDLKNIMRECAGEDESVNLNGDIIDETFSALGYDSLAVLETVSRLQRAYGISISDEELDGLDTPRAFLEHVNREFSQA